MNAFNHKAYAAAGFQDFSEYADCVTYFNQQESGYGDYEGEWFYADDDTLTIYTGTFGNDHCAGASMYTYAEKYDTEEEYKEAVAELEAAPEYLETEEPEEEPEPTFRLRFCAYNGLSYTVADGLTEEEVAQELEKYLQKAKANGKEVEKIGERSYEVQYPESGVGDGEGILTLQEE